MRPDDFSLGPEQNETVRRQADRLLREASAIGRFPTPIDDLMAAAKLIVIENEVLDDHALRRFMRKADAGLATLRAALSKVLGLFEPHDRLVVIDRLTPAPRVPFIKLHEAGHGYLPHQSGLYKLIHDCEKTLDPDITDLFEREANAFASEVLFQGATFATEAHASAFSLKVPLALAKKYGASNYSTFRRYVITSPRPCSLVVLEQPIPTLDGDFRADVRRIVSSKQFSDIFDTSALSAPVHGKHTLGSVVPRSKRMTAPTPIYLKNRNGEYSRCVAEAFNTSHQILILIRYTE
jgi:Zn-dependent peptidase ImmA (M78 family)